MMKIEDIERGLFQMARLTPHEAESQFPQLSSRLKRISFPNAARSARQVFDLLRELREEHTAPDLVEEVNRLVQLEPARA